MICALCGGFGLVIKPGTVVPPGVDPEWEPPTVECPDCYPKERS